MMKSLFPTLSLAVLLCILSTVVFSCKKDDPDDPTPPGPVVYTLQYTLPSGTVNLSSTTLALYSASGDNRMEYCQWTSGSKTIRIVFSKYINDGTGSGGHDPTDAEQDSMFVVGPYTYGYGNYTTTQIEVTYDDGVNLYTTGGSQTGSAFTVTEVNAVSSADYRKEVKGSFNCILRASPSDTLLLTGGTFIGHLASPL